MDRQQRVNTMRAGAQRHTENEADRVDAMKEEEERDRSEAESKVDGEHSLIFCCKSIAHACC